MSILYPRSRAHFTHWHVLPPRNRRSTTSLPAQAFVREIQEELQREHACLDMIPALQMSGDLCYEQQLLLPAAALCDTPFPQCF